MRAFGLFATTAMAACLAYTPAMAQASDDDARGGQVEEIVVTARKIAERLQDVPLAISAMSSKDLERQGVREPSDLSNIVPGLNYEKDFGRRNERPVIRGQSNVLGVPNVSFFVDGVFVPSSLFGTDLAFVERVEVIKGPQSALYGRQSFAGAISYISKDPSPIWERTVKVTGGSFGHADALASISGPLIEDKLGMQLAVNYYTFDGEYRNNAPGDSSNNRRMGSEQTTAASVAFKYTGIENLALTFRTSVAENDDGPEVVGMQRASANNCFLNTRTRYYCGEIKVTPQDLHANLDLVRGAGISRRQVRSSLTGEYELGDYTLTSLSGFSRSYESRKSDLDYLPVAASKLHTDDAWQIQSFSQEFRIQSPAQGAFSWLAGVYYYNSYNKYSRFFFNDNSLQLNGTTKTVNYAAFGLVKYDFTDKLSGTAELRVARDDLSLVGGASNYNMEASFKSTNPRFTLDYKVTPDILVFASAAKGNKPGGFNSDVRLPAEFRTYGEEKSWQYELGVKSDLLDRRLRLNGSIYYIDWTGQQLTQSTLLSGGTTTVSFIRNVGDLEVRGAELEAQAVVNPNITLRASASVADSEYVEGYDPESFNLMGNGDITGKTSPNAPRNQYSVGVNAWAMLNDTRVFLDADFGYRSKKYDQVANLAWVPGRGVANMRFGAELEQGTVTVFVNNIFDNIDPVSVTRYSDFLTTGPQRSFLGAIPPGRRVGVTFEGKF